MTGHPTLFPLSSSSSRIAAKLVFRNRPLFLYATHFSGRTDFSSIRETLMRLLRLLFVVVVCFVVVGFWQGWFTLSRSPDPDTSSHKVNLNVSVDKDKMKADVQRAEEKIKEKAKTLAGKAKPAEPATK
jgi:hypothetical protein